MDLKYGSTPKKYEFHGYLAKSSMLVNYVYIKNHLPFGSNKNFLYGIDFWRWQITQNNTIINNPLGIIIKKL